MLCGKLCRIRAVIWQQKFTFPPVNPCENGKNQTRQSRVFGRDQTQVFGFENWRVTRVFGAPGLETLMVDWLVFGNTGKDQFHPYEGCRNGY